MCKSSRLVKSQRRNIFFGVTTGVKCNRNVTVFCGEPRGDERPRF